MVNRMTDGLAMNKVERIEKWLKFDDRCKALRDGLEQLDDVGIETLRRHLDAHLPLVLDSVNYDDRARLWCPLAVGIAVESRIGPEGCIEGLDNGRAKRAILAEGRNLYGSFSLNPISGVRGDFYRSRRRHDLIRLVEFISESRGATGSAAVGGSARDCVHEI